MPRRQRDLVRLCDAFGIPLVVVVDVPGYLPGVDQEWGGVVRRGAKLLHAFGEASVPRVTLVTRKIYGGAYIAMNSRSLGATKVFAWPDAEVAVMGAKAAVGILHKKKLAAAAQDHEREALHEELAAEHERIAGGVDSAIEIGVVDEKIDPAHTRSKLTQALAEAPPGAAGTRTSRCNHVSVPRRGTPRPRSTARSRSAATRPIRVRRSRMSSTVRAPSWVTANSNSARVTSIPSATGSVGRSQRAEAITLGDSAPYRATSEPGSSVGVPQRRNRIRRGADQRQVAGAARARPRSARAARARSSTSSAMCRYSVSLPPTTLNTPESDSMTAWSRDRSDARLSRIAPLAHRSTGVDQRPQTRIGA